jgi:hypothetical protein
MNIAQLREALLYSTVIHFGLLALWGMLFLLLHNWLYRLAARAFSLSVEQFEAINLGRILLYKMGVLLFSLVPYLALRMVE